MSEEEVKECKERPGCCPAAPLFALAESNVDLVSINTDAPSRQYGRSALTGRDAIVAAKIRQQELRLKCLELARNKHPNTSQLSEELLLAESYWKFVAVGQLDHESELSRQTDDLTGRPTYKIDAQRPSISTTGSAVAS
jgi:hypothetical protein